MSLPEISRRCLSCGAAVRAGGRFCPQCGNLVAAESAPTRPDAAADSGMADEAAPREWAAPTREFSAFVESVQSGGPRAAAQAGEDSGEGVGGPPATDARDAGAKTSGASAGEFEGAGVAAGVEDVAADAPDVVAADASGVVAADDSNAGGAAAVGEAAGADDAGSRGRVARVREGTRARVERVRDDARVALEETPDDAGLRFVVAAAVVFALFVFFLFLSTTVLR